MSTTTEHHELAEALFRVGDWIVDENWIVEKHNIATSSHSGDQHYKSTIEDTTAQIISLCGAGHVARSLHGLSEKILEGSKRELLIYGLGFWEPDDTKMIASLLLLLLL